MQEATQAYLRKAAIQALTDHQDGAAIEILSFFCSAQSHRVQVATVSESSNVKTLPTRREITEGGAHTSAFFEQVIRNCFLPFLRSHGRHSFTSYEMIQWLRNCDEVCFTASDMRMYKTNRPAWAHNASRALLSLKSQGIVYSEDRGKEYWLGRDFLAATA